VIKTRLDYFPWIEEQQRARKRQIESDNITLVFCAFSLGLGVEISARNGSAQIYILDGLFKYIHRRG
jgi:hypothetical protein